MKTNIKIFITLITVALIILSCSNSKKKFVESEKKADIHSILGFWETVSGYDAENIEFVKEDNKNLLYYSYLHSRPFDSGKFSFKKGVLRLKSESGDISVYVKINIKGNLLKITDQKGNTSVFKKPPKNISEKDEININLRNYLNKISAFTGLDNSKPLAIDFNWNLKGEKLVKISGLSAIYSLKGIADNDFQAMNEKVKDIGNYLSGLGFSQDIYNTSEIQDAYSGDLYVFIIVLEAIGKTNAIIIKTGKLKDVKK
jgi:hypothetical protein